MTATAKNLWRTLAHGTRTARSWAKDYWPGRRTVLWTLGMAVLFLMVGASVADAADGTERGGLLAPLNVLSSEGVPLDAYDLKSENGGATDIRSHVCNLLMGGAFALVRLVVGLMCATLKWVYEFPIVSSLINTADTLAFKFSLVVDFDLKLSLLFITGAFALGVYWIMRGRVAKGAGEILLTLLLGGVLFMPTTTPRAILGPEGPLAQTQSAAREAAQMTADANGEDPGCLGPEDKKDPSCAMRMMLTRTLVVQPYELLQYGIIPDPKSDNPRIRELADVHHKWITGGFKDKTDCGISWLPGSDSDLCKQSAWDQLKEELKKHGDEGNAAYNYAVNSNWDRVFGALLVLLTAILIAAVVLSMTFVHLGTQFADVGAATMTPVALTWGFLPGANRAAVWKWAGVFMASIAVEFATSVLLPAFGISTNAVLTSQQGTVMIQRMLLMTGLAVVLLFFHRRILAGASRIGERFAERMRYARIGGSAGLGEDSSRLGLAMSQAMAGMGLSPGMAGGGGAGAGVGAMGSFGGQSPVHAALLRRAQISQGLASMASPDLGPFNAASMVGGAIGEVRRGVNQLATPLRMAHHAVIGNPLPEHVLAKRRKPVNDGTEHLVLDGTTGEVLSDPMKPTPWGHHLHNKLLETRAGRLAIRAGQVGRLGYNVSPLGMGATWTRLRRATGTAAEAGQAQWQHYNGLRRDHMADQRAGWHDIGTPLREPYNAAAHGFRVWSDVHGPEDVVASTRNGVVAAALRATTAVPGHPGGPGESVPRAHSGLTFSDARVREDLFAAESADADAGVSGWRLPDATDRRAGSSADIASSLGPEAFRGDPAVSVDGVTFDPATGEVLSSTGDAGAGVSDWRLPDATDRRGPEAFGGDADAGVRAGDADRRATSAGPDMSAGDGVRRRIAESTSRADRAVWEGMGEPPVDDLAFGPEDLL